MTQQEFQQHATANPAWVQAFVDQGYQAAKTELTPAAATAAELKAAFGTPEDRDFLISRMDVTASMADHKAAYSDHLKQRNATLAGEVSTLKQELARIDPAQAGTSRIQTPVASSGNGESPLVADAKHRAQS